jgi:hypothetical protein
VGSFLGSGQRDHDPKITRHLKHLTLEQLETASEWIGVTVATPGWEALLGLVEREIAMIDRQLEGDRPLESRAHYAIAHGRRGGLRAMAEFAEALLDEAESRLEEQRAKHEQPVGAGAEG